jgi:predicted permease
MLSDLRLAWRALRRRPGFAFVAALTLAAGIGAATAIASVVDGALLRPLPYPDAGRLLTLWQDDRRSGRGELAPGTFLDVRERARSFSVIVAAEPYGLDLDGPAGVEMLPTWLVTEGFFDALAVRPQLGRTFRADEHVDGRANVVVLSDALWRRRFGGDPAVVGRQLTLDRATYTVVGVMPPAVRLADDHAVWAPRVTRAEEREQRGGGHWLVLGRVRPGVAPEAATREVAALGARLAAEHPRTNAAVTLATVPVREALVGRARPVLAVLLGGAALVLVAGCANVAGLLLARAMARERELAVRAALGAGGRRLSRLLWAEAAVLGLGGAAGGVALAAWGLAALRAAAPAELPRLDEVALDGRALAAALAVVLLTVALVGAVPAWRAGRAGSAASLGAGARATGGGRRHAARAGLVLAQVALSAVLLVGAGLLVRSVDALLRVDRGFRTERVLALTTFVWQQFPEPGQRAAYVRTAAARLAGLPGVRAVGATSALPLGEQIGREDASFMIDGQAAPLEGEAPEAHLTVATPGYFGALGVRLRRGRLLADADDERAPPVAVVNEAFARRHFGGADAVGRRVRLLGRGGLGPAIEVVGVVADVRQRTLTDAPRPALFVPHAQSPTGSLVFVVHTAGDPEAVQAAARRALVALAPSAPVASATTLEALLASALRERRLVLGLLGGFAAVALGLAALGVYAALSQRAAERRREMGVRVALDARARDVRALMVRGGVALWGAGLALGLTAAALAAPVLDALLFGVRAFDLATFAAAGAVVLLATAVASWAPARRAARVEPLEALRAD